MVCSTILSIIIELNLLHTLSRPSRARGLKYLFDEAINSIDEVAPLAGAWIEMLFGSTIIGSYSVAPLAGAWIEITEERDAIFFGESRPSRARGLKFCNDHEGAPEI